MISINTIDPGAAYGRARADHRAAEAVARTALKALRVAQDQAEELGLSAGMTTRLEGLRDHAQRYYDDAKEALADAEAELNRTSAEAFDAMQGAAE